MFRRVLILGDGTAGAENQALALWKRLGPRLTGKTRPSVVRIQPKYGIFKRLPASVHIKLWECLNGVNSSGIFAWLGYDKIKVRNILGESSQYPDLIIGCGRLTAPISAFLRFNAPPNVSPYNVQIQHPRVPPRYFNRIITPRHDFHGYPIFSPENADNISVIPGSLHGIDQAWLLKGQAQEDIFKAGKVPCRTIVIGAPHKNCRYNEKDVKDLIFNVLGNMVGNGTSILYIICSRRTPESIMHMLGNELAIFRDANKNISVHLWRNAALDGPHNPYQYALCKSSNLTITSDSISMMTECLAISRIKEDCDAEYNLEFAFSKRTTGKHKRFLVLHRQLTS